MNNFQPTLQGMPRANNRLTFNCLTFNLLTFNLLTFNLLTFNLLTLAFGHATRTTC
ncbi:hypothetical protein [Moorena producens]|uniref:hypothetical protein n=1 Tax=Moorena producens TaxID=1155739 RepID=UPI0013144A2B|nr:hypothetical protein [Moorena producens]